jgi:hypothetical protein
MGIDDESTTYLINVGRFEPISVEEKDAIQGTRESVPRRVDDSGLNASCFHGFGEDVGLNSNGQVAGAFLLWSQECAIPALRCSWMRFGPQIRATPVYGNDP